MRLVPQSFIHPVAASNARSEAQEIIDRNRREVEALTMGPKARRDLVRMLVVAQQDLAKRLDAIERTGGSKWTYADTVSALAQVHHELQALAPQLLERLIRNHKGAAGIGVSNTVEILQHFQPKLEVRALALREAMAVGAPLLAKYKTSVDRYGQFMLGVIQRDLQAGILRGAAFEEMTSMLVGRRGPSGNVSLRAVVDAAGNVVRTHQEQIEEGLFVRYRGWAERIVRTEGMASMNAAVDAEVLAQRAGPLPDLQRKLIETFDNRTAKDSIVAHGQVRAPGELFHDGAGREYQRPPGRPNDRAVLIPWRAWATKPHAVPAPPDPIPKAAVTPPAAPPPPPVVQAPPTPPPPAAPVVASITTAAKAPAQAPTEGVHFGKFTVTMPAQEAAALLDAVPKTMLAFLERNPIHELLLLAEPIENRGFGVYTRYPSGFRDLRVTADRGPETYGRELAKAWSFSTTGPTRIDAMKRTLVHELGHHVHLLDDPTKVGNRGPVDMIVRNAYAETRMRGRTLTPYGATDHAEYFAESFVAYHRDRATLAARDPVGLKMVKDVCAARGVDLPP